MNGADLWSTDIFGVLECISQDPLAGSSGDKLDALDNTVNDNMLDTGVFSFGVLSDKDSVDVIVWGFVSFDRTTRADIGEEIEGTAEG